MGGVKSISVRAEPVFPIALSLSKGASAVHGAPFDRLRANGGRLRYVTNQEGGKSAVKITRGSSDEVVVLRVDLAERVIQAHAVNAVGEVKCRGSPGSQ